MSWIYDLPAHKNKVLWKIGKLFVAVPSETLIKIIWAFSDGETWLILQVSVENIIEVDPDNCVWTKEFCCDSTKRSYLEQVGKVLGCNEHFNCQILEGN